MALRRSRTVESPSTSVDAVVEVLEKNMTTSIWRASKQRWHLGEGGGLWFEGDADEGAVLC